MPMSPEKIKMFSLTESGSDLAFFSPDIGQNEEEVRSREKSPPNPAFPCDQNPKPSPNKEAHFNENLPDGASSSQEENPNRCTNQNKEPVESFNPYANPNKEPLEEPFRKPETFSDNQIHGPEKQLLFSCSNGGVRKMTGEEKAGTAASAVLRKLPAWASNQSADDERDRCGKSQVQTENKGNDFPLPQNLQQVIEAFSVDFDEKKYNDMDLLDIAEMKGIVFENPSWWPAEDFQNSSDQVTQKVQNCCVLFLWQVQGDNFQKFPPSTQKRNNEMNILNLRI
jgi:hypothetical protein